MELRGKFTMIMMTIYSENCTKYGIMQVKNIYSTLKFKQISIYSE